MNVLSRSFADVVKDVLTNVQEIVRSEVRLAKSELREEAAKVKVAAGLTVVGVVFGAAALAMLPVAGVAALSQVMPVWAAALVVGAILLVIAAVLLNAGVKRFRTVHAMPQRTMDHLKGDLQWVKQHAR